MIPRALICGCSGPVLTDAEREFFADVNPWGLILFARNIESHAQITALTQEFRALVRREDAPVFIDQEGGRVQRIRPPLAENHPPAEVYARLYERDPEAGLEAARLGARLMAAELYPLGITADCVPVLDLSISGAHDIIGDRAYGTTPQAVAALGGAAAAGLIEGGVLPVMKHIPGHGRANADSHEALPVVKTSAEELERTDFQPFRMLNALPMAMTAHVVYTAYDMELPATLSLTVIKDVIRESMGFEGLLMSDDLSMKALSGPIEARAAAALEAGCDMVLHCNGDMAEMLALASIVPPLLDKAATRAVGALSIGGQPQQFDQEEGRNRLRTLLDSSVA